jgi:hypothetical protein
MSNWWVTVSKMPLPYNLNPFTASPSAKYTVLVKASTS